MSFRMKCVFILASAAIVSACGFQEKPIIISTNGCYIDSVQPANLDNQSSFDVRVINPPSVKGWIADIPNARSPKFVSLVLMDQRQKGYLVGSTSDFTLRPDVAKVFNEPNVINSGFEIKTSLSNVPPGEYFALLNADFDNSKHVCRTSRPWTIVR